MKYLLTILGILLPLQVSAGVYKCVDANGNKIYRSQPCTGSQSKAELNIKTGGAKDLDALDRQKQQSELEQKAQEEEKKHQQEQVAKQKEDFNRKVADENDKNQALVKSNPQKYSAYAIPPYLSDELPPLVKRFEDRLPDIQRMRREAAEKALATGECGRVESSELSSKSIEKSLVILVDCSSAKKFYLTERELAPPPIPEVVSTPAPEPTTTPTVKIAPTQ